MKTIAIFITTFVLSACGNSSSSTSMTVSEAVQKCQSRLVNKASSNPSQADAGNAERDMDICMAGYGFKK